MNRSPGGEQSCYHSLCCHINRLFRLLGILEYSFPFFLSIIQELENENFLESIPYGEKHPFLINGDCNLSLLCISALEITNPSTLGNTSLKAGYALIYIKQSCSEACMGFNSLSCFYGSATEKSGINLAANEKSTLWNPDVILILRGSM